MGVGTEGGAGIGSGADGWSYTRSDGFLGEYSEVPIESSSIRISGGSVMGMTVGGGAAIGGGSVIRPFHGCLGNLYITGGRVFAIATYPLINGAKSVEAIGHGYMYRTQASYRGEFTIYGNAKVEATTSNDLKATYNVLSASKRTDVSHPNNNPTYKQVEIGPCDHSGATYTDNGNGTHTVSGCSWCLGETVGHTFTDGTCVCGAAAPAETWTVTVNTYDAGTGAYVSTHYDVEKGSAYTLPACDDLSGYEFAGWVADPTSQANGCQPNDGETLLAAGHELTVTADVTLYARYRAIALSLADDDNNSTVLARYLGKKAGTVTLQDRTLSKSGEWNTLCLPFDVTIADSPLAGDGVTVMELDGTTSNLDSNGQLTIHLTEVTSGVLTAGKPYFIKWNNTGKSIVTPVFRDVTVTNIDPATQAVSFSNAFGEDGQFVGSYSPLAITDANIDEIIFFGDDNTLGYASTASTLRSCRAHFVVSSTSGARAMTRAIVNFGDGVTTSISEERGVKSERLATPTEWFTLDGRKLNGKPAAKGVYIENRKRIIIK